ncbi:MAG: hypothetical protein HYT22_01060 [Candidatus Niyogibacteria bacterium]|nr:hypothetical protein [Candidatus Niyogibacteria bacterium]
MTSDKRLTKVTDEDVAMEVCDHPDDYFDEQKTWAMDFLKFGEPPYRERFENPFIPKPLRKKHAIGLTQPRRAINPSFFAGAVTLGGAGLFLYSLMGLSGNAAFAGGFGGALAFLLGIVLFMTAAGFEESLFANEPENPNTADAKTEPAIADRSEADAELDLFLEDLSTIDDLD